MEGAAILIVEDEAISALYIKNLLTQMRYRVLDIVSTGENAVEKAEELRPDLILMDIRLAGEMDGIAAATLIHQRFDIPVVFLTAHMDEGSIQRAMAADPAGYLSKPTNERELRGTIEMALKNDRLKKQLQDSEARYRRIFNTASVSISELDFSRVKLYLDGLRQDGIDDLKSFLQLHPEVVNQLLDDVKVLNANEWNLQLFEASNLRTLMRSFKQNIRTQSIEIFRELLQSIWEGAPYHEGEGSLQTLTNEKKNININVAFLTGGADLSRVLMVVTDITRGKKAEAALRKSEETYRRIVITSQEGIWILNREFKTTFVNARISEMLGYPAEEIIGHSVEDFLFPEQEKFHKIKMQTRKSGKSERYEMRFRRKDGSELWVIISATPIMDEQGEFQGSFAMFTDITERKQIEKALAESEARYRQIVETTREGIWILDKNFKMVFANRRIAEMLGYSHEELMGMDIDDLVFDEDMADHNKKREARRHGISDQYERQFRCKDGKPIWVNVTATALLGDQGELQNIIAMITDISQRKEAEQIFERRQAHIRTMDALSQELSKQNLDFQAILQIAAKRIIDLSGDICIIRLVSDDGLFVQPIVFQLPKPWKKFISNKLLNNYRIGVNEGLFSVLCREGRALLISQEATPELISLITKKYQIFMQKFGIINGMVIPLRSQGEIIGDILLGRKKNKIPYNEDDLVFFQEVADRIGLTISNARMYSKIQNELEERRAAEAALRISEQKYRDLFDLSPDSIILISPEGIILDCNMATSKLSGLPKEDMVGKLFYQIITLPVEKYPEYSVLFNRVMSEEQTGTFEIEISQLNGQRLDIEVFPKIIKKDNVITGVLVILRDITERKINEQKLKDSLIEKETLLSELNHRVKNNLASIVSILDLQKIYITDRQMVDLITELQERIRLMALIHQQLYRSKNLSRVDFTKYLQDLTTNLKRALLKGRDIQLDIQADSAQLGITAAIPCGQIVTELVTNALKYAFPLAHSYRWETVPPRIEVSFKTKDDQYILKVSDNGVGFPPDLDINKAETLGLQLVILLTKQLNGEVSVKTDEGVSVSVSFPVEDVK